MTVRLDPFAGLTDPPKFEPKPRPDKPGVNDETDRIADSLGFPSRQAPRAPKEAKRKVRTYRTGRNRQFNLKAKPETVDRFYRLADERNVPLGALMEQALDALERAGPAE